MLDYEKVKLSGMKICTFLRAQQVSGETYITFIIHLYTLYITHKHNTINTYTERQAINTDKWQRLRNNSEKRQMT